jgi:hypothetical protein
VQLDAHNEQAGIDLEIADRSGKDLISKGFGRCWGKNLIASGGLFLLGYCGYFPLVKRFSKMNFITSG